MERNMDYLKDAFYREVAGDSKFIPLLIGMGLDEFSMNSNKVLQTRKLITQLDRNECEKLVQEVINMTSSQEVKDRMEKFKK